MSSSKDDEITGEQFVLVSIAITVIVAFFVTITLGVGSVVFGVWVKGVYKLHAQKGLPRAKELRFWRWAVLLSFVVAGIVLLRGRYGYDVAAWIAGTVTVVALVRIGIIGAVEVLKTRKMTQSPPVPTPNDPRNLSNYLDPFDPNAAGSELDIVSNLDRPPTTIATTVRAGMSDIVDLDKLLDHISPLLPSGRWDGLWDLFREPDRWDNLFWGFLQSPDPLGRSVAASCSLSILWASCCLLFSRSVSAPFSTSASGLGACIGYTVGRAS